MELYRKFGAALRRKCERMTGSREEAEDVVQTLFVELVRTGRTDVGLGYLFRAATNACLNRLRDRRRRAELLEQHGQTVLGGVGRPIDDQVMSLDLLVRLVDLLEPSDVEILVYRYLDRMSQDEVAELVGLSRKTVGRRLAEIRARVEALAEPRRVS